MKDRRCIVCFTTADRHFLKGARRIKSALNTLGFEGDFLHWHCPHDDFPEGCPIHLDSPWGFKPWAIKTAYDLGYRLVLWLDSSVVPVDVEAIFRQMTERGSYFVRRKQQLAAKTMVANACSDAALASMGIDRATARNISQISAQRIGLNLRDRTSLSFLAEWHRRSLDGISFKGYSGPSTLKKYQWVYNNTDGFASNDPTVLGHRHDQTIASIIVNQLQIPWDLERDDEAQVDKAFVHHGSSRFA